MRTTKCLDQPHPQALQLRIDLGASPASSKNDKKVLVVEDGQSTSNDYWLMLEEAGYQVTRCSGSLAALFAVVRTQPDLVIVELRIPVMNGLALVLELKAYQDTRHLPVVVLAAEEKPKGRNTALRVGCDAYVTRRTSPADFIQQIAVLLRPLPPKVSTKSHVRRSEHVGEGSQPNRPYETRTPNSAFGRRR